MLRNETEKCEKGRRSERRYKTATVFRMRSHSFWFYRIPILFLFPFCSRDSSTPSLSPAIIYSFICLNFAFARIRRQLKRAEAARRSRTRARSPGQRKEAVQRTSPVSINNKLNLLVKGNYLRDDYNCIKIANANFIAARISITVDEAKRARFLPTTVNSRARRLLAI